MVSERLPQKMTIEEYLAYEEETGIKHEFIDGEVFAMAGGTNKHNTIALNCASELRQQLRQKPCHPFNSDMKVKINDLRYVYPDFSVVCGEQHFADDNETMLKNPTLVAEVMSPSSRNYDKGDKADYYFSLPSVQIYLLLDQNKPYAQIYTRHQSGWLRQEFTGLDAIIPLEAIDCELKLSEAYLDVFE